MIQSAMMFALGVFVSGLLWLALAVLLVRRARHLTARRLLASVSTRRAEFETERDELRARHAVEMHQQEREVSRVLDMATAYRLEADVKERDISSLNAELRAREEDYLDLQHAHTAQRQAYQDLERRHAEDGAALRAVQHALKLESRRRTMAEEALDEATITGDQRRIELSALRAQNEALRTALGDRVPFEHDDGALKVPLPPELPNLPAQPFETQQFAEGSSVVPLRARQANTPEQSAALVADATRSLQRIAGEGHAGFADGDSQAAAVESDPRVLSGIHPNRPRPSAAAERAAAADPKQDIEDKAETRFFEALSEIRALKRASGQAAE
jgi:hypothetical protein